jgi:hypothetical protein
MKYWDMFKPVDECSWQTNVGFVVMFVLYLVVADGWFWKLIFIGGIVDNIYHACKKKGLCT